MISSEFRKEEYWMIKWPLLSLVLSLVVAGGLLAGLNTLDASAANDLRIARNDLTVARENVDKIEEEEATIIEYIGRYREIQQDGVVSPEDRLQFQEMLNDIRREFTLFPVPITIGGQTALPLAYTEGVTEPGSEVVLHTSLVELNLPMLHENDLARMMASLAEGPGILQPLTCTIGANSNRAGNYIYLARHFNAACSLNWYTFQLPPAPGVSQ